MVECELCGEEFDSERELHLHWGKQHKEKLNSHQEEKVKKAKREEDKDRQRKQAKRKEYRDYAIIGVVLVGLVAGGALAVPKLNVSDTSRGVRDLGPTGSAHKHADFQVYVNGRHIDFSQPKYQVVSQKDHVEGGNGNVVHGHATGATFRYFLRSVGFDYNATYMKTPEKRYYETGDKQVRMFVNTAGNWREIDPKPFNFETGDRILLTYGNYTGKEISQYQNAVTNQSKEMS